MTIDKIIDDIIEDNIYRVINIKMKLSEVNERFDDIADRLKNTIVPVKVISDGDGHNYIIPNHRQEEYEVNLTDTDFINSGRFDDKWSEFRTGGDINNRQLYTITTDI